MPLSSTDPMPQGARLRTRTGRLLDAVLGVQCGICAAPGGNPCAACRHAIEHSERTRWRCACCALPIATAPLAETQHCAACLHEPRAYDRTLCAADYGPPLDHIELALKFAHRADHATTLGLLLADAFARADLPRLNVLVPVPLSPARLAERGYNQSALIAQSVAHATGLSMDTATLARIRHTDPAAQLDREARARMMQGAFAATRRVDGQAIGLVDDVMTTGATMQAAAHALKAAGAQLVIALAVLRTP